MRKDKINTQKYRLNLTEDISSAEVSEIEKDLAKLSKYYKKASTSSASTTSYNKDQYDKLYEYINKYDGVIRTTKNLKDEVNNIRTFLDRIQNEVYGQAPKSSSYKSVDDAKANYANSIEYKNAQDNIFKIRAYLKQFVNLTNEKSKKAYDETIRKACSQLTKNALDYLRKTHSNVDENRSELVSRLKNAIRTLDIVVKFNSLNQIDLITETTFDTLKKASRTAANNIDTNNNISSKEEFNSAIKTISSYASNLYAIAQKNNIKLSGSNSIASNTNWLELYRNSSSKKAFWIKYFSEYWEEDGKDVERFGGDAFKIQCENYGFNEKSNPFIYFIKNFILKYGVKITPQQYATIHNAVVNHLLQIESLAKNDPNRINIIWCKDLYKRKYTQIESFLWYISQIWQRDLDSIQVLLKEADDIEINSRNQAVGYMFFGENNINVTGESIINAKLESEDWILEKVRIVVKESQTKLSIGKTQKKSAIGRLRNLQNTDTDRPIIYGFFQSWLLFNSILDTESKQYTDLVSKFNKIYPFITSDMYKTNTKLENVKTFWSKIYDTNIPNLRTDSNNVINILSDALNQLLNNDSEGE